MYRISKEFHFSASHRLDHLPAEHPCSRLHGHNYIVIMELEANELNHVGFVVDYRRLTLVKEWIDSNWDHYHLNDKCPFNPTAENMAKYLFRIFKKTLPQLAAVIVKETPKTMARYEPAGDPHPDHINIHEKVRQHGSTDH